MKCPRCGGMVELGMEKGSDRVSVMCEAYWDSEVCGWAYEIDETVIEQALLATLISLREEDVLDGETPLYYPG